MPYLRIRVSDIQHFKNRKFQIIGHGAINLPPLSNFFRGYTDLPAVVANKVDLRTNRMISNNFFFTFSNVKVWPNELQWAEDVPNSCTVGYD